VADAVDVMVSVADDRLANLDEVVAGLRRAGLNVGEVLEAAGTVTGTVDPDAIDALCAVPGVVDVERQRDYQIAPPDSDVQ
jgi:hypothetical protein